MGTHKITRYYTLSVIIITAVSLVSCGVAALFKSVDTIIDILSFARAVITVIALPLLFKTVVGFEQNKFKSIPVLLFPLGLYLVIRTALFNFATAIPTQSGYVMQHVIRLAASSVLALLICVFALKNPIEKYAALYEEKHTLVFPQQYGLHDKWWFIVAGLFAASFFTSFVGTIGNYFGNTVHNIVSGISVIIYYLIFFLFFNIALSKIDKVTRWLFLPNVFLAAVGSLVLTADTFICAVTPIMSPNQILSELRGGNLEAVALSLLVHMLFSLCALVSIILLCNKNFESYEQKNQGFYPQNIRR